MTDDIRTLFWIAEFVICALLLVVIKVRVRKRKRFGIWDFLGYSGVALAIAFFAIQASKVLVWSLD